MRIGVLWKTSVALALLGAALPLAAQTADPASGGTGSDTGSSGSATSGGKAAAATAGTPASTPTTCTVSADSASAGAADKSGSGSKSASGTTANASQSLTVQATVTSGGTPPKTGAAGGNGGAGAGASKPARTSLLSVPLGWGNTNAAEVAPKLANVSSRIVSAVMVDAANIEVILDVSPDAKTKAEFTLADQNALRAEIRAYALALAHPDPGAFVVPLPPGTGNACDVAHALFNALTGIESITAVDDSRLMVSTYPANSNLQKTVETLVKKLAAPKSPAAAKVETRVQKLYYLHDPVAVATLIKAAFPNLQAQALLPDVVVLSDPTDLGKEADDATANQQEWEKPYHPKALDLALRTVTRLDQPHPQVSVDAWVLQMATQHKDAKDMHEALPELDDLAGAYNAAIDKSIGKGWTYLSGVIADPANLDPLMRTYLTYTTRLQEDGSMRRVERPFDSAFEKSCDSKNPKYDGNACGYGLGFASLYYPLTPNLIDMLVALSSVNDPNTTAKAMLEKMGTDYDASVAENGSLSCTERDQVAYERDLKCDTCKCSGSFPSRCPETGAQITLKSRHLAGAQNLSLSCVAETLIGPGGLMAKLEESKESGHAAKCPDAKAASPATASNPALVAAAIGRQTAHMPDPNKYAAPSVLSTSQLGQLRAALADFLFQYKLMVEYPDEFHSYLEPMAADTLDSAFAPIVSAFDQDLGVFEEDLQKRVSETLDKYKKTLRYGYGGLVSVKVLGSQTGSVTTATQNYFDATPAPTLNDFFTNLQAEGASIQKTPLSPLVTSLVPAKAVELLTVLGQTLTPKPTTAELGRGLDLTVTAHTLSGAYGAELDLAVQSTENGAGLVQAGAVVAKDDLNSRVSQHTVNTHIRVDSLRLFKVSTMSSTLARAQAPWKFIDPLFEVPALGQLIKKPRPPELVDTQSMIFVDAVVVPTAADLGTGVPIIEDQLDLGGQRYRRLKSLNDFPGDIGARILQYHQAVVDCLNREYIGADGTVMVAGGQKCAPGDFQIWNTDAVK